MGHGDFSAAVDWSHFNEFRLEPVVQCHANDRLSVLAWPSLCACLDGVHLYVAGARLFVFVFTACVSALPASATCVSVAGVRLRVAGCRRLVFVLPASVSALRAFTPLLFFSSAPAPAMRASPLLCCSRAFRLRFRVNLQFQSLLALFALFVVCFCIPSHVPDTFTFTVAFTFTSTSLLVSPSLDRHLHFARPR